MRVGTTPFLSAHAVLAPAQRIKQKPEIVLAELMLKYTRDKDAALENVRTAAILRQWNDERGSKIPSAETNAFRRCSQFGGEPKMVGGTGIEPVTSSMSRKHSTAELTARCLLGAQIKRKP
jgi:hypothetical protein